jgi:hypothetical protein
MLHELLIGIKRGVFRANDPGAARADAEFAAKRDRAKESGRYRCIHCGWVSRSYCQLHHLDDNHHNNAPENLGVVDQECHAYHHVGEPSKSANRADKNTPDVAQNTTLAAIPEMSAQDANLLMRAIGVAYASGDEQEIRIAQEIHKALASRRKPVQEAYGTSSPGDFALAMSRLNAPEYVARADAVRDLRIIFSAAYLRDLGIRSRADYPIMQSPREWAAVFQSVEAKRAIRVRATEEQ